MRHLDDGTLRQMLDEPLAIPGPARRHYAVCPQCQAAFKVVSGDAQEAARLLGVAPAAPDTAAALLAVRQRLRAEPAGNGFGPLKEKLASMGTLHRVARPLGVAAAVGALALGIAVTPAASWAQNLLSKFQPNQVVAVSINPNDLRTLPSLDDYGTVSQQPKLQEIHVADAAAASQASGMAVLQPSSLPAGVPTAPKYVVIPTESSSFTFSAAKAAAAAKAAGKPAPAFPAGIDGSTLNVSVGPVVVTVYGNIPDEAAGGKNADAAQSAAKSAAEGSRVDLSVVPPVILAQAKAPVVTSSGVSASELEQFLLDQPGVSNDLKQAIRGIGDPNNPIPLPVPIVRGSSHPVQVHGVSGLAISDPTGLSGIVWQQNGIVYHVGGTLPESQLLAIANSLH